MPSQSSSQPASEAPGGSLFDEGVLDSLAALVVVFDCDGRLVRFNRACERLTGYAFEEVQGLRFWDLLVPPDELPGVQAVFEGLKAGLPNTHENDWIGKDGQRHRTYWSNACVPGPDGRVRWVVGCGFDVTAQQATQRALDGARRNYQELIETIDGIVWEADAQTFQFTYVSAKAERLLGYPVERWLKEPTFWVDHLHPEDRGDAVAYCVASTGKLLAHDFSYRMRAADGRDVWLRDIVQVLAEQGRPKSLRGVMVDITEQKRLEQELSVLLTRESQARARAEAGSQRWAFLSEASQRLSAGLDYERTLQSVAQLAVGRIAAACLVVLGEPGRWQEVAFEADTPAIRPLLIAQLPSLLGSEAGAPTVQPGMPLLLPRWGEGLGVEGERQGWARQALLAAPIESRSGRIGALLLVGAPGQSPYDEDDRAVAQQLALRCASAVENGRLFRQAEEAIRSRDDFLSIASHELKTPLTPLSLRLQLLERTLPDASSPGAKAVSKLRHSVVQLTALVDDLLDASRIAAGRLPLARQPLSLRDLVQSVAGGFVGASVLHRVEVSTPQDDVRVEGDPTRLEQVFSNLIENAIKYSPLGGPVVVRLEVEDQRAIVSVHDQGIGVPPEDRAHLFERFFRARNASGRAYGGLGLGLYISRDTVERHGGKLWLESAGAQPGSTFLVELPLA